MPFGSLTSAQQILVRLYMKGGPEYEARMIKAGLATKEMATSNQALSLAMAKTTQKTWLQNQALFTMRRFAFYATIGIVGLAAEVVKLGFSYDSTMQQTRVALSDVIKAPQALNKELAQLYRIAALTPFNFQEVTVAFRQMYLSLQPFGVSIKTVNDTITAVTDNLSAVGKVTPANLNRVSIALTHMANVGYLSGQALNQLGKDGIQIQNALRKELGLTGDQLANIGALRLSPDTVLNAIIKYSSTAPGIRNQAIKQSNKTLLGAWSTFKDIVSQASGTAVGGGSGKGGVFGSVQGMLAGVNLQLSKFYKAGKPVTIELIARAFDKQLTPSTHAIYNIFVLLNAAFSTMIGTIKVAVGVVGALISALNYILKPFGDNHRAAKLLGQALGILAGLWLLNRARIGLFRVALEPLGFILMKTVGAFKALKTAQEGAVTWNLISRWKTWATAVRGAGKTPVLLSDGTYKAQGPMAALSRAMLGMNLVMMGWIGLAVAIVAILVILYFKWKPFRDIVNETARWFWKMGPWARLFFIAMGPLGWVVILTIELVKHWQTFYDIILDIIGPIKTLWDYIRKIAGHLGFIPKIAHIAAPVTKPIAAVTGLPVDVGTHHKGGGLGGFLSDIGKQLASAAIPFGNYIPGIGGGVPGIGIPGTHIGWTPFGGGGHHQQAASRSVTPVQPGSVAPVNQTIFNTAKPRDQVINLVVDRKVLAQAVARANQDHAARR